MFLSFQVMNSTILQQIFVVEYVIQSQMCPACHSHAAKDFWKAVVQIRQKVCDKLKHKYSHCVVYDI